MKKLQDLKGAKALSKKEQQSVKGGGPEPMGFCWCGGIGTQSYCLNLCGPRR